MIKLNKPLIVDIKRNSYEDGPGIRTTIFFKGCPLSCIWCHNPECQSMDAEIGFFQKRCISCFECERVCKNNAITRDASRVIRSKCNLCFSCVDACPGKAIQRIGRYYEIDELLEIILRDEVFYKTSNGGITLSGGEPTLFPEYINPLLIRLKEKNIHIAIQTSGFFEYSIFKKKIFPYLNLCLFDVKVINPDLHKKYTGRDNKKILENLMLLSKENITLIARTPIIPGFTDGENILAIKGFLSSLSIKDYVLLPYNPLGVFKNILKINYSQHTKSS
ncbi:MAG: glycyl-radical enzyme activating protein [bacterium]